MGVGCRCRRSKLTGDRKRAIFLDRDGVLIRSDVVEGKPFAITKLADVHVLERVPEACAELSRLGFLLVMVTNQPDVARGKIARSFVESVNHQLKAQLRLEAAETCFHDNQDNCDCRKPRPGLLLQAAARLSVDLGTSIMVGDRWRDIEAGRNAGCKTVFIDCGYNEPVTTAPDHSAKSLSEAVAWIRSQV